MTDEGPTTVYLAGRIRTGDARRPIVQAMAVRGEWVLAVGGRAEVLKAAGRGARVRDLAPDAVIVPGLSSAHAHLASLGRALTVTKLRGARSPVEIVERLLAAGPENRQTPSYHPHMTHATVPSAGPLKQISISHGHNVLLNAFPAKAKEIPPNPSPKTTRHSMNARTATSLTTALLGSALLLQAGSVRAQVNTYEVNLKSQQFSLYTDPYNGNQIKVGGFSGLYPVPGKPNSFYAVSDRGPAPDYVVEGTTLKCFPIPEFGPHLITVRLMPNGSAKIDEVKPLKRPGGGHITGLPTTKPVTDVPYDFDLNQLPYDEDSLDAEGITIDPWGNFWICEEYKPSVAMVAPNGEVQLRLVPDGTVTGTEVVPTYGVLPKVLSKRRNNRGFEGIAATPEACCTPSSSVR